MEKDKFFYLLAFTFCYYQLPIIRLVAEVDVFLDGTTDGQQIKLFPYLPPS